MAEEKTEQKVYMPLMIGDWLKGTSGMRAEVKGVYINLLLYQWDNGFIPSDMEDLALIAPEVHKVWDKLKVKFPESEPGKLQNKKLEKVRDFWAKQKNNGKKGGRPKKDNPNNNPEVNPKHNHHNDLDLDNEFNNQLKGVENKVEGIETRLTSALDEIYIDGQRPKWSHIDFDLELVSFQEKVRGSPSHYQTHNSEGLRLAFQAQLRNAKRKLNGFTSNKGISGQGGPEAGKDYTGGF